METPETTPNDELVGTLIDSRYRIEAALGEGGMGKVYRAEHVRIRRQVAVKILHEQLSALPTVGERFEREAIAIGRLDHPNCVAVQDFGRLEDGTLYLVMQLLDGLSVADALTGPTNRLPWPRALHIGRHTLAGLGHAHRAGLIHRDIKPENIMLVEQDGDRDFAKILDFGIAKVVESGGDGPQEQLTEAGMAFGTPTYMSPEQALGEPLDGRTDLYSVAVVLYELIAGAPPFKADDKLSVLAMHTSQEPAPIETHGVEIPDEVESLLQRGLAKVRDHRFATADEFAAAIDDCLERLAGDEAPPRPRLSARSPAVVDNATREVSPSQVVEIGEPTGGPPAGAAYAAGGAPAGTQPPAGVQRSRRRGLLAAALAAGALLTAVVVALALSAGPGESELAAEARALIEAGDPQAAVALLEKKPKLLRGDAAALVELGHARATLRQQRAALAAYDKAIAASPDAARSQVLETDLVLMMDDDSPEIATRAAALLIEKADNRRARQRLIELASTADKPQLRERAREQAQQLGLGGDVDYLASYLLDLVQGKRCRDRKEAVARLRALGNPAAIPALEKAIRRTSGTLFKSRVNRCLADDAREAISYLEQQK